MKIVSGKSKRFYCSYCNEYIPHARTKSLRNKEHFCNTDCRRAWEQIHGSLNKAPKKTKQLRKIEVLANVGKKMKEYQKRNKE